MGHVFLHFLYYWFVLSHSTVWASLNMSRLVQASGLSCVALAPRHGEAFRVRRSSKLTATYTLLG